MGFSAFLGNARIVEALGRMLRSGRLPHALLFAGQPGLGKFTLARMLALAANCEKLKDDFCGECDSCRRQQPLEELDTLRAEALKSRGKANPEEVPLILESHPDIWVLVPDGQFIRIGQVREVKRAAYLRPQRARRRFFIFDGAEQMRPEAANSMLKVLEEPPDTATLILVAHRPFALLPTIRSRAIAFHFAPLRTGEIEAWLKKHTKLSAGDRRLTAHLADGSLGRARSLELEESRRLRKELVGLLRFAVEPANFERFFATTAELAQEKEDFAIVLDLLYSLLNDVLSLQACHSRVEVQNTDLREDLEGVAHQVDLGWIQRATRELDRIEGGLRRNVNRQLAVESMFLELGRARSSQIVTSE